ncbi:MAG: hypothetical protein ACREBR_03750 [bacterium]
MPRQSTRQAVIRALIYAVRQRHAALIMRNLYESEDDDEDDMDEMVFSTLSNACAGKEVFISKSISTAYEKVQDLS